MKFFPRIALQAHKSSVGTGQADVEIYQIDCPVVGLIHHIQIYCTAIVATASVVVKKNGAAIIAATTPVAGTPSIVVPTDSFVNSGDDLTVHVTTDATGTFTDLSIAIIIKQQENIGTI